MVNPNAIQKSRDAKKRALDLLYATFEVGVPRETTDGELAILLGNGLEKQDVRNLRGDLIEVKAIETRRVPKGSRGLANEWTLVMTRDQARDALDKKWLGDDRVTADRVANINHKGPYKNGNGHEKANADTLSAVLVAETGPATPKPMAALGSERYDEPRALVEAARQFAGLHKQVDAKIKELEGLGIKVDRERLAKAVQLPADPRLAAIADAMPYIEHLERANERLGNQVADQKEKLGNLPELNQRLGRLHAQNERLVSDNAALRARLEGRPDPNPTAGLATASK